MRASARFLLLVLCLFAFALSLSSSPRAAFADDKKVLSKARAQFQAGIELEQAGNWAAALEQFREVGQVRMTPQLRFHIGLCEENLGRLVAALGGYELALADADSVGPDFRAEVEANVAKLRARIPKLVIARGQGAEAAAIELDGVALGASSIGVELPIDPGPHVISAKAPGHKPFSATVSVNEEETNTVTVTLENLESGEAVSTGGAAQTGFGSGPADKPPSRLVPYVIGGAGAAFLVASGVLFVLREGALGELQDKCENGRCPKSEQGTYDSMVFYHYGAQVSLGVGIAAVGTAVTMILLEKKKPRESQAALALAPGTAHGLAGATLSGAF
jgi:hypothetical protein